MPRSRRTGSSSSTLRRDLHAHPELSWHEQRTTDVVAARLEAPGSPSPGCRDTGLVVDIGDRAAGRWSRCAPTWTRCPSTT